MEDTELYHLRARMGTAASAPWERSTQGDKGDVMDVDGVKGNLPSGTAAPKSEATFPPAAIPAPDSPTLSVQLPSSPRSPVRRPELASPLGRKCEPSQAPAVGRAQYDQMTWDQLHEQCCQSAFRRKESEGVLETRLASVDAAEAKRIPNGGRGTGRPELCGRETRAGAGEGVANSDIPARQLGKTQLDGKRERAPAHGGAGLAWGRRTRAIVGRDIWRCA